MFVCLLLFFGGFFQEITGNRLKNDSSFGFPSLNKVVTYLLHHLQHSGEPLYSKGAVIAWWLQLVSA